MSFHPTTQKSNHFTSIGYFGSKHIWFGLYRWVTFHDTEVTFQNLTKSDLAVSKMAWRIE